MWFLIVLVAISSFLVFDHEYLYMPHILSRIIFFVCVVYWFFLVCSAFFVNREAYKNAYATSELITQGIYKKMRHPMYIGDIVLFLGFALLFPMTWIWVTVAASICIFIWFMFIEDAVLYERFGRSFSAYKRKMITKRVVVKKVEIEQPTVEKKSVKKAAPKKKATPKVLKKKITKEEKPTI